MILYYSVWAREHCRIIQPCFLAECHMKQLNQASFILLYFALYVFSWLCLVFVVCLFLIHVFFHIFQYILTWMTLYSLTVLMCCSGQVCDLRHRSDMTLLCDVHVKARYLCWTTVERSILTLATMKDSWTWRYDEIITSQLVKSTRMSSIANDVATTSEKLSKVYCYHIVP